MRLAAFAIVSLLAPQSLACAVGSCCRSSPPDEFGNTTCVSNFTCQEQSRSFLFDRLPLQPQPPPPFDPDCGQLESWPPASRLPFTFEGVVYARIPMTVIDKYSVCHCP